MNDMADTSIFLKRVFQNTSTITAYIRYLVDAQLNITDALLEFLEFSPDKIIDYVINPTLARHLLLDSIIKNTNEKVIDFVLTIFDVDMSYYFLCYILSKKCTPQSSATFNKIVQQKDFMYDKLSVIFTEIITKDPIYLQIIQSKYNIDNIIFTYLLDNLKHISSSANRKIIYNSIDQMKEINVDQKNQIYEVCNDIYSSHIIKVLKKINIGTDKYRLWIANSLEKIMDHRHIYSFSYAKIFKKAANNFPDVVIFIDINFLVRLGQTRDHNFSKCLKKYPSIISINYTGQLLKLMDHDTKLMANVVYFIAKKSGNINLIVPELFTRIMDHPYPTYRQYPTHSPHSKLIFELIDCHGQLFKQYIIDNIDSFDQIILSRPDHTHIICNLLHDYDISRLIIKHTKPIIFSYMENIMEDIQNHINDLDEDGDELDHELIDKIINSTLNKIYTIVGSNNELINNVSDFLISNPLSQYYWPASYDLNILKDDDITDNIVCKYCQKFNITSINLDLYSRCFKYVKFSDYIGVDYNSIPTESDSLNNLIIAILRGRKYNKFVEIMENCQIDLAHAINIVPMKERDDIIRNLIEFINQFYSDRRCGKFKRAAQ